MLKKKSIQIQHLLKLNMVFLHHMELLDQNSNTTFVKVKSVIKQPRYKISSYSNTTFVKVKFSKLLKV